MVLRPLAVLGLLAALTVTVRGDALQFNDDGYAQFPLVRSACAASHNIEGRVATPAAPPLRCGIKKRL